jgi:hypothetical protein
VWARRGGLSGERAGPKQFEDMKRVLDEHHRKRSSVSRPAPVLWTRPFLSWAPPKTAAWIAFGFFIISISTLFIMGIFVGAGTDTQFDNLATALSGERGASQAPPPPSRGQTAEWTFQGSSGSPQACRTRW